MERRRLENNFHPPPPDLSFLGVRGLIHQSPERRSKALPALSAPTSAALPPFAPALTFIYLDLFHVGANNPLTGSFIRMTSSNPRPAAARLIPLILPSDWVHYGAANPVGLKRAKGSGLLLKQAPGKNGRRMEGEGGREGQKQGWGGGVGS